jgi:hypothetical protein
MRLPCSPSLTQLFIFYPFRVISRKASDYPLSNKSRLSCFFDSLFVLYFRSNSGPGYSWVTEGPGFEIEKKGNLFFSSLLVNAALDSTKSET